MSKATHSFFNENARMKELGVCISWSSKDFQYKIMGLQQSSFKQILEATKTSRTNHSWFTTYIHHIKVD